VADGKIIGAIGVSVALIRKTDNALRPELFLLECKAFGLMLTPVHKLLCSTMTWLSTVSSSVRKPG
jgi:hypothetical protein